MAYKSKTHLEYVRQVAKQRFQPCVQTWIDCLSWVYPSRAKWLMHLQEGERNNRHVADPTATLGLRSSVAGFSEGNTSATRPWFRGIHQDEDRNRYPANREWLDKYTRAGHLVLNQGNFYNAVGQIYYDVNSVMTSCVYVEETVDRGVFFHSLTPGSYYLLNNSYGEPVELVREFSLTVKALVEGYGRKVNGQFDWSNISRGVRIMYERGEYTEMIDVVQVVCINDDFDADRPVGGTNRKWVSYTYECGKNMLAYSAGDPGYGASVPDPRDANKFLKVTYSKRKPFFAPKNQSSNNFEYGETGPTLDCLGLIKSINKKAVSKDRALDQMLSPATQGPANLRRSYVTTSPNSFVPVDPSSLKAGAGLRPIFEVNPAVAHLTQDVSDLRQLINQVYYVDYLMYLSRNPKTRTAAETNAVIQEQQLVIGPALQSLNLTLNNPVAEFVLSYVLDNDPSLPPPPESLQGQFIQVDFISPFAQAQKATDLPSIDRYVSAMMNLAGIDPRVLDKVNLDRLGDIYEDRLYLPVGLNRAQDEVDRKREAAARQAQMTQLTNETIPALAGAMKDARKPI